MEAVMSEPTDPSRSPELDFRRAEYVEPPPAATCGICRGPIHSVYYQINATMACERCQAQAALDQDQGSGVARFLRATVFGAGAAAAGTAIWYAVEKLSDRQWSLIAILIGFMVGKAVWAGSRHRGGWRYQALAVFLTYASIVSAFIPALASQALREAREAKAAKATATPVSTAPAEPITLGKAIVGLTIFAVAIFAFACLAPFLMGAQNIIGLVIIAIGLYEAWKINRHVPLEVSGPFRLGEAPAAPAAHG
jgi:hypothetical protein